MVHVLVQVQNKSTQSTFVHCGSDAEFGADSKMEKIVNLASQRRMSLGAHCGCLVLEHSTASELGADKQHE